MKLTDPSRNEEAIPRTSKTDWKRVRAMKDKDIKFAAEHPELDVRHMVPGSARRRRSLKTF